MGKSWNIFNSNHITLQIVSKEFTSDRELIWA